MSSRVPTPPPIELVRAGVDAAQRIAAGVEIPRAVAPVPAPRRRIAMVPALSGWIAAAILGAILISRTLAVTPPAPAPAPPVTADALDDPRSALARYVLACRAAGRTVEELPLVTLETRPGPAGRTQVMYVRRLLERATVDETYRVGRDEHGRARIVAAGGGAGARTSM
jgi:hypothetical protein